MEKAVILCVDITRMTDYAAQPLDDSAADQRSAIDLAAETVHKLAEHCSAAIHLFTDSDSVTPLHDSAERIIQRDSWSQLDMIQALSDLSQGMDRHDSLLLLRADAPLLLLYESLALIEQHQQYFAHFSFCDGFPAGCTPEAVSVEALPILRKLAVSDVPFRRLFAVVERDINAFDIETRISPVDFRLLRLDLYVDSRRRHLLCSRLARRLDIANNRWFSTEDFVARLQQASADFRTLPASLNLVLHTNAVRPALYYPELPEFSSPVASSEVVQMIAEVAAWAGDLTVTLSHLGEPAAYPGIYSLLEEAVRIPGVRIVIETDAVGWDRDRLSRIAGQTVDGVQQDKLVWIAFLDAIEPELYQRIRPGGDLAAARAGIAALEQLFPDAVYIQAVRMDITEAYMLDFYRYWKEHTEHIIIQKFNHYAGHLTDHRVADTAPIQRLPCWRLKRELTIMPDGSVRMCHVDLTKSSDFGNIYSEPVQDIWNALDAVYRRHTAGDYPDICVSCDEYYTFTF